MKKGKRLYIRSVILLILFGSVIYTVFQSKNYDMNVSLSEGKNAPDFVISTIDGDKFQLAKENKNGVILNFWASWCKPCESEMPVIDEAFNQYRDKGIKVLAVNSQESNIVVTSYVKKNKLSFPIGLDNETNINDIYNVNTLPVTYFINSEGIIVYKYEGEMNFEIINNGITKMISN